MKKIIFLLSFFFLTLFVFAPSVSAITDPTLVPNNKFGIHVVDAGDLENVAKLTNSNGGDWGYVTLVIQKGERDTRRWQRVFDEMRRLHLIPIVRVATAPNGDVWEKPNPDEIDGWVSFFNSLNWVIKNRYITVGNEPNHAKEWGGQINPSEYATYLKTFSGKLKSASGDYFILPAGLDASAGNTRDSMDESTYLARMISSEPDLFNNIDGWASHSYPNPNFSGSPDGVGKGSVRSYLWEEDYLKTLGVTKNLPVFITETGWTHDASGRLPGNTSSNDLGAKYEEAYKYAWNSPNVVAVTPFVFSYQDNLFDMFSWKKRDGNFYNFYYSVQNLTKVAGKPVQVNEGEILSGITPQIGNTDNDFYSLLFVKNNGQAIWDKANLGVRSDKGESFQIVSTVPATIEPGQIGIISIKGKLPQESGSYKDFFLLFNNQPITQKYFFEIKVIPFVTLQTIIENAKMFFISKLSLGR
ncbi:MAG TPA: hypothetical protein VF185_03625 [Patescibacteria group bacterium]